MMFKDTEKLKKLVDKAIGEESITDFAKKSGVHRTYLSKLKNDSLSHDPKPGILRKIAENNTKVRYVELMVAAGYLDEKYILNEDEVEENNKKGMDLTSMYLEKVEKKNPREMVTSYNYNNEAFWDEKKECVKEDYFTFPEGYVTDSSYALKMTNNEFKDLGIIKDDYILIRPINDEPENGSTILVVIRKGGGCRRTIKRYYIINKDKVRLEPDVENYGEIDKSEIEVKGLVVYVGRKYIK